MMSKLRDLVELLFGARSASVDVCIYLGASARQVERIRVFEVGSKSETFETVLTLPDVHFSRW